MLRTTCRVEVGGMGEVKRRSQPPTTWYRLGLGLGLG